VLLSTSAEAEVYRVVAVSVGDLQSRRSFRAHRCADANGDGQISYAEMAAFIDTTTGSVPNPNFRPQVLAKGPHGN